ncbi:MAG: hypothetical protein ACF8NJ_06555 [Phycisphaerales bacterium JB038]
MTIAIGLLIIDTVALYFSYGPASSEPWLVEFGSMLAEPPESKIAPESIGGVYEFLRAALALMAATFTLGSVFRDEFLVLLGLRPAADPRRRLRFQIASVILAILLCVAVVYYHLVHAPASLQDGPNRWTHWRDLEPVSTASSADYSRPYRWYMPYSIVGYIFIWLPVCVVAVFAAARDVEQIEKMRVASKESPPSDHDICHELVSRFDRFAHQYAGILKRYSWLFLFIAAAITFEQAFAWTTLAGGMVILAYASYLALGLGIIVVLLTLRWYEEEVSRSTLALLEAKCSADQFREQYGATRFLLRAMRGSIALIIGVALIAMFFGPAAKLLNALL